MTIRSFIALVPDENSRAKLAKLSRGIKALHGFDGLRFVDSFNFHLTLAFLDQQKGDALKDIADAIDENLHAIPAVSQITLSRVEFFPLGKQPKVLAALVEAQESLSLLHQHLLSAIPHSIAHYSKIRQQAKSFTPHISLARLHHRAIIKNAIHVENEEIIKLSELAIFESVLHADGPVYKPLYQWQVGK